MLRIFIFLGCIGAIAPGAQAQEGAGKRKVRIVFPKSSSLNFEGAQIEGELKNPSEFFYQARAKEKFEDLTKRRTHFHRELVRDTLMGK